jgi:hypothetical protein
MANGAHTTKRTTALERAHSELTARIADARPPCIPRAADAADAAIRADHMVEIYDAMIGYLETVLADSVNRLPVDRGCRGEVEKVLWDQVNGRTNDLADRLLRAGVRFASEREAA